MLLLIAAFSREFAGLRPLTMQGVAGLRWVATLDLAGDQAILVANGAGRSLASAAAREILSRESIQAVISTGFAGALDPSYLVGDVFIADSVRGEEGEFSGQSPVGSYGEVRRGALLTVDRVVQSASAKRELWKQDAQAVDMEAAAVAAVAREHSLPFFCIRVISDVAAEELPVDFDRALRSDGSISPWSVLGQALRRPDCWSRLARLRRNAATAAESLGACLRRCEFARPAGTYVSS
jgi:nucleoside phosphorylase